MHSKFTPSTTLPGSKRRDAASTLDAGQLSSTPGGKRRDAASTLDAGQLSLTPGSKRRDTASTLDAGQLSSTPGGKRRDAASTLDAGQLSLTPGSKRRDAASTLDAGQTPMVPGTKTARSVSPSRQLDWFRSFWRPAPSPPPPSTVITTPTVPDSPSGKAVIEKKDSESIPTAQGSIPVEYVRHPRALRYRLIFRRDGTARCTIPRGGTLTSARRFVAEQEGWLLRHWRAFQLRKSSESAPETPRSIYIRGEAFPLPLETESATEDLWVGGPFTFKVLPNHGPLLQQVEQQLRALAARELPQRLLELARIHGLEEKIRRITIRSQRTRWGSCSRRGTISLNWRLLQLPPAVSDYILLHELAHLRHLNHGPRFWAEVERLCPDYLQSEKWLKQHGRRVI